MHPTIELPQPRFALVVANSTYRDPDFTKLRAPAQDAADMIEVLGDPDIGGFTVTPVIDQPEHLMRVAVGEFLARREPGDIVVIYLSCHGVLDARGRLYFAAINTSKTLLSSTGLESTWLLDQLEDCRARSQVLILDCCFSGAFGRTKGGGDMDLERRLVGSGRGRTVLTASRAGEYSYEGEPLPAMAQARSVFTAALVEGLRTGAADRHKVGLISVEDAYRYAAREVAVHGGRQSPQRWVYGGEGEVLLARNPHGASIKGSDPASDMSSSIGWVDARELDSRAEAAHIALWITHHIGRVVGAIGLALPCVLIVGHLLAGGGRLLSSLSDYGDTEMRTTYIAGMCVMGALLLIYRGKSRPEKVVSRVAGVTAIGLALLPIQASIDLYTTAMDVAAVTHSVLLSLFLLAMAYFCFLAFMDCGTRADSIWEKARRYVLLVSGIAILICFILILLAGQNMILPFGAVLWLETGSFQAFGVAWMIHGVSVGR